MAPLSQFVQVTGSVPGSVIWPWQCGHSMMASWLTVFRSEHSLLQREAEGQRGCVLPRRVREVVPAAGVAAAKERVENILEAPEASASCTAAKRILAAEVIHLALRIGKHLVGVIYP